MAKEFQENLLLRFTDLYSQCCNKDASKAALSIAIKTFVMFSRGLLFPSQLVQIFLPDRCGIYPLHEKLNYIRKTCIVWIQLDVFTTYILALLYQCIAVKQPSGTISNLFSLKYWWAFILFSYTYMYFWAKSTISYRVSTLGLKNNFLKCSCRFLHPNYLVQLVFWVFQCM